MSMTPEDQIAALTALKARATKLLDAAKARYLDSHLVDDKATARVGGETAGTVSVVKGSQKWALADKKAMLEWALEHAPHLVSWEPSLDEDTIKVLASAKDGPTDKDGEIIPGWELKEGAPYVSMRKKAGTDLEQLVEEAIAAGTFAWAQALDEIEGDQ